MATQPFQPRTLPAESGEIADVAAGGKRSAGVGRELAALLIFAAATFISLALLSFKRSNIDPSVEGGDLVGPVGATVAGWLVQGFGVVAWLLPVELGLSGYPLFRGRSLGPIGLRLAGDLIVGIVAASLVQVMWPDAFAFGDMQASGNVGLVFGELMRAMFSTLGSLLVGATITGLVLLGRSAFSFIEICERSVSLFHRLLKWLRWCLGRVATAWSEARRIRKSGVPIPIASELLVGDSPTPDAAMLVSLTDDETEWIPFEQTGTPPIAILDQLRARPTDGLPGLLADETPIAPLLTTTDLERESKPRIVERHNGECDTTARANDHRYRENAPASGVSSEPPPEPTKRKRSAGKQAEPEIIEAIDEMPKLRGARPKRNAAKKPSRSDTSEPETDSLEDDDDESDQDSSFALAATDDDELIEVTPKLRVGRAKASTSKRVRLPKPIETAATAEDEAESDEVEDDIESDDAEDEVDDDEVEDDEAESDDTEDDVESDDAEDEVEDDAVEDDAVEDDAVEDDEVEDDEAESDVESDAVDAATSPAKNQIDPSGMALTSAETRARIVARHSDPAVSQPRRTIVGRKRGYRLPSTDLLEQATGNEPRIDRDRVLSHATRLEKTLLDYGVVGKVEEIHPGPTVTTYELAPQAGTKVSKVSSLADDLALGLSRKVRIIAPIPGKSRIGFEIPNDQRIPVNLRELVEDPRFAALAEKAPLPVVLGRDIVGAPFYADLASMPHVIVAGATGAGKSVGLNVMLASLLFRRTPDELRLLMIDPKVVELAPFDKIPHLLLPVVTDMKQANQALKWAVDEMERRYQLFATAGTKNVGTYNRWVERVQKGELPPPPPGTVDALTQDGAVIAVTADAEGADGRSMPGKLPYIVIVIDEFADLMMQQGKEVETSVARLAQKARAAGLHVVLATQRPSVDVITGMIKANFPSRIAFLVAQRVDSRTILDEQGAEMLLGRGDMLVKLNGGNEVRRVQCPFISEDEVSNLTDYIRTQGQPQYHEMILQGSDEDESEPEAEVIDARFEEAVRIVAETQRCSTSWLQRKMTIGYNRAAKIVEMMERRGMVGPPNGAKDREVLVLPH